MKIMEIAIEAESLAKVKNDEGLSEKLHEILDIINDYRDQLSGSV